MSEAAHIVGTRPNIIKLHEYYKDGLIIHTGQHWDKTMSPLDELKPDIECAYRESRADIMAANLVSVLKVHKVSHVTVYGDSNTTVAGAIAAKTLQCQLVHVESGLRVRKPTIEEMNRVTVDALADEHICPYYYAYENLLRDGFQKEGDLLLVRKRGEYMRKTIDKYAKMARDIEPVFEGDYYLLTIHRSENLNTMIYDMIRCIAELAYPDSVVFPIHPHTHKYLHSFYNNLPPSGYVLPNNFSSMYPLSYIHFLNLMLGAKGVITDSGGVVLECDYLGKDCIILRDVIEWEHVKFPLVGLDVDKLKSAW